MVRSFVQAMAHLLVKDKHIVQDSDRDSCGIQQPAQTWRSFDRHTSSLASSSVHISMFPDAILAKEVAQKGVQCRHP
jgi:hypothetical protein